MKFSSRFSSWMLPLAIALFTMAERSFSDGTIRTTILVCAGALFVIAAAPVLGLLRASSDDRAAGVALALPWLLAVVGGADYWFSLPADGEERTTLQLFAFFVGVFLLFVSFVASLVMDVAAAPMRMSRVLDASRLWRAFSVVVIASSAVFAVLGLNYAAKQAEIRRDFSFASPNSPSDATLSVLDAAGAVEVYLFFEKGSEALVEIGDYFEGLKQGGAKVEILDAALDPKLAKEVKVRKNGTVAFRHQGRSETWFVGTKRADARRKLKKIDKDVRTRLSKVSRDKTLVYLTTGHGERDTKKAKGGARDGLRALRDQLKTLNVTTKSLGLGEGLAQGVPEDANIVAVVGPTSPFLDAEVEALLDYAKKGGGLYVLVDPNADPGLDKLLQYLGVSLGEAELLNDREFIPATQTAADFGNLIAVSFTKHDAVATMHAQRGKAGVLFRRARAVNKRGEDKTITQSAIARSRKDTFADLNNNRRFDADTEKRQVYDFALAIERPADEEGQTTRAIVVGDSDLLGDGPMRSQTHQVTALENVLWLMKDDLAGGALPNTGDVPITHSRDEDTLWFYLTTFGAPLTALGLGLVFVRSRRRRRSS